MTNKGNYLKLTPMERALLFSAQSNGKYTVKQTEEKNGFYFTIEAQGIKIKVPFGALLSMNSKTEGIAGICFTSAKNCPSKKIGLCQVPKCAKCYAQSGEARATKKFNNGSRGMDSFLNAELSRIFWDSFAESSELRNKFIEFLESKGIDTIRFNLKGDFQNLEDLSIIYYFAESGFHMVGYTARDDLKECQTLGRHPNVYLNGSNVTYTNRFRVTNNLDDWFYSKYRCLGHCADCMQCYSLRGVEIVCLVHGQGSETALNHYLNRIDLVEKTEEIFGESFESINWRKYKSLIGGYNDYLRRRGINLSFKSSKEAYTWLVKNEGRHLNKEGEPFDLQAVGFGYQIRLQKGLFKGWLFDSVQEAEEFAESEGYSVDWRALED